MRLTRLQSTFSWTLVSFSSLLVACGGIERPDAVSTYISATTLKTTSYNIKKDYDDQGNRKPDAKPVVRRFKSAEELLLSLNVAVCFDVPSQKELHRFLDENRKYLQNLKDRCGVSCLGL